MMKKMMYIGLALILFLAVGMASAADQNVGAQIACGENMKSGIEEALKKGASANEITKALIDKGCNPKAVIIAAIEAGGEPTLVANGARVAGVLESVIIAALLAAEVDPNEVGFAYTPPTGMGGAPARGAMLHGGSRARSVSESSPE